MPCSNRSSIACLMAALAASGALPLDDLITDIRPLSALRSGFEDMEKGGRVMKILLEI